jgi:hypothetical protein
MPKGAGLEWRSGTVTKDSPVQFHVHPGPHVLVPTDMMMVDTEHRGTLRLMKNEAILVYPNERHRLWVEDKPAGYTCTGIEGRL